MAKTTGKMKKLTAAPAEEMRAKGAGYKLPGTGTNAGSKRHGVHTNVVNAVSHGMKLKGC